MPKHPFLDPESFLDYGVKIKDYQPKWKPTGLPPHGTTHNPPGNNNITSSGAGAIGTGSIRKLLNGNFLFFDVPYQGRVIECIERPMDYIDGGKTKTQTQHLEWLSDPKNKLQEYTIADIELEYQLLHMSFNLRSDSQNGKLAQEYITKIREIYHEWVVTADHIQYGNGLEAIITNKGKIASKPKAGVIIPTYKDNHFVLSVERPEIELDTVKQMDPETQTFLKQYLGVGSEHAGKIFPYCATRNRTNLRETRLWTPDSKNREERSEGVGGLGVSFSGRFVIVAIVTYVSWRALVVAERKK